MYKVSATNDYLQYEKVVKLFLLSLARLCYNTPMKLRRIRLSIINRSLSFTRFGAWFIIVCLAVGIAAINTGNNLLYLVVAMMLSMMLVSGILSEQALKKIRVTRRLPDDIYAGTPFPVRFSIHNEKSRIPSYSLSVSAYYPNKTQGAGGFLPRLGPGESGAALVDETVALRGRWVCSGFEVSTLFPFGLFVKIRRFPREEARTVYPHVRTLDGELTEELSARAGELTVNRKGHGSELRSLRLYQEHDEARLIHWKSSARSGVLMAKEYEAETKRAVCVILDNLKPLTPPEDYNERFEEAVTLAATVIHNLMQDSGLPVSFMSRDGFVEAGLGAAQYALLMETLAALSPSGDAKAQDDLSDALSEGVSVMVLAGRGWGWSARSAEADFVIEAGA